MTDNTVYGLGSITKQFTTTLLGKTLKNTGTYIQCLNIIPNSKYFIQFTKSILIISIDPPGYSWETKVRDILSDLGIDFFFYDFLRSNLTSLRDLGSHSTGLARNDYLWIAQNMSRSEQVDRLRYRM